MPKETPAASLDTAKGSPPSPIERLRAIMARLRDPKTGCPWDAEQTFRSVAPYTIEEAYEVADAIERADLGALKGELGDLLLQVVFHAQMAAEAGLFDFDAVANAISDKLVERHPHVFSGERLETSQAQIAVWEHLKAAERAKAALHAGTPAGALDGVAIALPALTRAEKLGKRAARVGFEWPDVTGALSKIEEELTEVREEIAAKGSVERLEHEVGDLLFACTNLARHLGVDPEAALRRGNIRFESRFRHMEALLAAQGREPSDADLDELEALWQRAKAEEK
jgi:MazG family protein